MQRREGYTTLTTCQPLYTTSRKEFQSEEKKRLTRTNKFTSHCYTSPKFCLVYDCSCVSVRTAVERFPCLSSGLSEGTCSSLSSSHVDILSDGHLIISWLTLVKFRHKNYLKRSRKCPVALGFCIGCTLESTEWKSCVQPTVLALSHFGKYSTLHFVIGSSCLMLTQMALHCW